MNILPFVFAILFILSYGIGVSLQNHIAFHRNHKAGVALAKTRAHLLRQNEQAQFNALPGTELQLEKEVKLDSPMKKEASKEIALPPINFPCARLNLFLLINEEKEAHLPLYETAAKLLRTFYQKEVFGSEKRFEYRLLDQLLISAKKSLKDQESLALETLALKDPNLQPIYYRLLKGTKKHFPSLLEYFKVERAPSKICLFHAHPKMMTVFFGEKTAYKLYQELHKTKKAMKLEAILEWANDSHLAFVDAKVWELLDFHRPKHESVLPKTVLTEEGKE